MSVEPFEAGLRDCPDVLLWEVGDGGAGDHSHGLKGSEDRECVWGEVYLLVWLLGELSEDGNVGDYSLIEGHFLSSIREQIMNTTQDTVPAPISFYTLWLLLL